MTKAAGGSVYFNSRLEGMEGGLGDAAQEHEAAGHTVPTARD